MTIKGFYRLPDSARKSNLRVCSVMCCQHKPSYTLLTARTGFRGSQGTAEFTMTAEHLNILYKLIRCAKQSEFSSFFFLIYLFYFWLHWVFVAARGLSLVAASGATLGCGARASHCGGFSCWGAQALGTRASVVVARGLSSCGSRA